MSNIVSFSADCSCSVWYIFVVVLVVVESLLFLFGSKTKINVDRSYCTLFHLLMKNTFTHTCVSCPLLFTYRPSSRHKFVVVSHNSFFSFVHSFCSFFILIRCGWTSSILLTRWIHRHIWTYISVVYDFMAKHSITNEICIKCAYWINVNRKALER